MGTRSPGARARRRFRAAVGVNLCVAALAAAALLTFSAGGLAWFPATTPPEPAAAAGGWTDHLATVEQQRALGIHQILKLIRAAALVLVAAACGNLLFRGLDEAAARRREVRLRAALGASPRTLLLAQLRAGAGPALIAAGAGWSGGLLLLALLRASWPTGAGAWAHPGVGASPVMTGVVLPLALLLACTALPAAFGAARNLARELLAGTHVTAGPFAMLVRGVVARGQFVVALGFAACAAILLRGSTPGGGAGLLPDDVRTWTVQFASASPASRVRAMEAALARIGGPAAFATPAAWTGEGPEEVITAFCRPRCVDGNFLVPILDRRVRLAAVSAGHFDTMGIRVVAGRPLLPRDRAGAEPVAVVSRMAALTLFPGQEAVGQRLVPYPHRMGIERGPLHRVVGVVEDFQVPAGVVGRGPLVYLSALQHPPRIAGLAVRGGTDPVPAAAGTGVRLAPGLSLRERGAQLTAPAQWSAGVLSLVALAAMGLAAFGLHGVISAGMAARAKEIGVRLAIGAGPRSIAWLAVASALRISLTGALIGAPFAVAIAWVTRQAFGGLAWWDPGAILLSAGCLTLIAVLASWAPARRAAATEPREVLTAE